MNLDAHLVESLFCSIQHLEAQETLVNLRNLDYPMMKEDARKRLFRDLNKRAFPSIIKEEQRALTIMDLANLINQG